MSLFVSPRPFKRRRRAKAQRNHNPRVGGSSPSSGMRSVCTSALIGAERGICSAGAMCRGMVMCSSREHGPAVRGRRLRRLRMNRRRPCARPPHCSAAERSWWSPDGLTIAERPRGPRRPGRASTRRRLSPGPINPELRARERVLAVGGDALEVLAHGLCLGARVVALEQPAERLDVGLGAAPRGLGPGLGGL